METRFLLAVAWIGQHQKRLIEEHLLCFGLADCVLVDTLSGIAGIPVESNIPRQIHIKCILSSYTQFR